MTETVLPDGIEWSEVDSSNVLRLAWEPGSQWTEGDQPMLKGRLFVEFASGAVYAYAGVPQNVFDDLISADEDDERSVGSEFNISIKAQPYEFEKLAEPE